ncbi:MAG: MarR family transcriptional regulator [Anaerolineaceae bacterium]|nr:MarR family transcriptional regulator [Anaerolineaceae bacterium]
MKELSKTQSLRFNGSLWCNLDIALRNLDQIYSLAIQPLGLTVIEWYILRALFEQDGQHASELARAVGRAATSFTPILDKLQKKNMIERRADPADRRAVRIFLTDDGRKQKSAIRQSAERIDSQLRELFPNGDYEAFQNSLVLLQSLEQN